MTNQVAFNDALALLHQTYKELKNEVDQVGGCDHTVGICVCREYEFLGRVRAFLVKHGVEVVDTYKPDPDERLPM